MRLPAQAFAVVVVGLLSTVLDVGVARADPENVTATAIERFAGAGIGERVQALVWRGGMVLAGGERFGGFSGIDFIDSERFVIVSDVGWFVSGRLRRDAGGRPSGFADVEIEPIRNSSGAPLPSAFSRDAEAVSVIVRNGEPGAVRVGYENLTRVADFDLVDGRPGGPAREVPIPGWLSALRTNQSIESLCIAPPASPVAGSTVIITEQARDGDGDHRGWMLGRNDTGPLTYRAGPGSDPTDCAFLPNGDLLVLERGVSFLSFTMRLVRVPADEVRPGVRMSGRALLEVQGRDIDNMEGLAVHEGPDGTSRITIVSDDNFNGWQRNLWLEFSLE